LGSHSKRYLTLAGSTLLLAFVYAGTGRVGQLTAIPPGHITLIWPASGIALAAVLLFGRRVWPGIWLGSFVVNNWVEYGSGHPLSAGRVAAASALIGLGATVGTLAGAAMLRRTAGDGGVLDSAAGVIRFLVLGAMLSSVVSPTVGVASLCAFGVQPWALYGPSWWTWWLGDTTGVLVVAPLMLSWWPLPHAAATVAERLEAGLAFGLLFASSLLAFWGRYPLVYAVIPILVWISVRCGFTGATAASFVVSSVAIVGTIAGRGPFANESLTLNESLLMTQLFLGVVATTTLLLTAAVVERKRAETALRAAHDELDARVRERTAELADSNVALREAKEAAERSDRAKSSFLANMSHELRTPMNAVLGFAQLLDRDHSLGDEQRRHIDVILGSGEHLLGLINDVLSLAQIEAGKASLADAPFDLVRMLGGLEAMVRLRAEAKGLRLRFDLAPDLPAVVAGDEGKLRQMLLNLLGNAVKFTDRGEVRLAASWRDGQALFEVEDTGPGVGETEAERLFEPFYQAAAGRRREGTGLGLAITRNYARLMGGDVTVRSVPGAGATFTARVPLAPAEASAARSRRRVTGLAEGVEAPRVLVVDDDPLGRAALAALLGSVGFDVAEAASGREALERCEAWRPALVLTDLGLEDLHGFDLLGEIRSRKASPACKVVALTSSAFESDRETVLAAGFDGFVAKPYWEDAIFGEMAAQLGVRYVYEDGGRETCDASALERLAALGPGLRTELRRAVSEGDPAAAAAAVDRIAEHDADVAAVLHALLRAYRFDDLQRLLEAEPAER
jgi:signal transduction histidine kinase/DNA-binding NarL/FixJ family response regulator